jgi:hypothetical protein
VKATIFQNPARTRRSSTFSLSDDGNDIARQNSSLSGRALSGESIAIEILPQ